MTDENNQRDSERVPAEYEVRYHVPDIGVEGSGTIRDMSDTGAQFVTDQRIEPGSALSLKLPSPKAGTPPLMVAGQVVRCIAEADGSYAIACVYD